jgi:hypothetical protein
MSPADDVFYFGSLPGDANGDGHANVLDLLLLGQYYNDVAPIPGPGGADFDANGVVNVLDLLTLGQRYNTELVTPNLGGTAPPAVLTEVVAAAPVPAPNGSAETTAVAPSPSPSTASVGLAARPAAPPSLFRVTPATRPSIKPALKVALRPPPAAILVRPPQRKSAGRGVVDDDKLPNRVFADTPIQPPARTAPAPRLAARPKAR